MAESRDDFIIAIRSAFLKKSTKQKFSLLTLVAPNTEKPSEVHLSFQEMIFMSDGRWIIALHL